MEGLKPVRRARLAMLASAAMLGAVLLAQPAYAQPYPVDTGPLPSPSGTLAPGGTVEISAGGFAPGATVTITVESAVTVLATVSADAQGVFSASVTLPNNLAPGTHTLRATGEDADGGTLVLSYTFTVGGPGGGDGALPQTGYPIGLFATAGGSLLLAGLGLMTVGVRRRRRSAEQSLAGDDA